MKVQLKNKRFMLLLLLLLLLLVVVVVVVVGGGFCCVLCDVFRVLTVCVHSQTPSFQPLNDSFIDSIYQ